MAAIEVTTQQQLDAAIKGLKDGDWIVCLGGTWDRPLVVYGSASVTAYDSASVTASGSASVRAYGSASVTAYDSASVRAYGSASVTAYDSASVTAYDSASVRAYGSASVTAYDSASVTASGSASVTAYGSASVEATKYVSVHSHDRGYGRPTINGGVTIEVPNLTSLTAADWCDYYGVEVKRGSVLLYKALDDDYSTSNARAHNLAYTVGAKVACDDWNPEPSCGGGLHVSPRPWMAVRYNDTATRYVQVRVKIADLVVIDDKAKTPRLTVVCECDQDGEPITAEAAA